MVHPLPEGQLQVDFLRNTWTLLFHILMKDWVGYKM